MEFEGSSSVVTGGGNGIGRALCLELAKHGSNVAVSDIELASAESVAAEVEALGVKAMAIQTDVASEDSVTSLADSAWNGFGSVDILVNNAGVVPPTGPLFATSAADFDWIFSVNVGGVMNGIRTFIPRFIEAGRPARVLTSASEHSLGIAHLGVGLYTASKHALLGLSDVLRREVPEHIQISVLCPGLVDSTLWKALERRQDSFGGAGEVSDTVGAFMQHIGMSAGEVAQRTIAELSKGTFLIVTHPHGIELARERWDSINAAFSEQAPRFEGDEKWDLNRIQASQ